MNVVQYWPRDKYQSGAVRFDVGAIVHWHSCICSRRKTEGIEMFSNIGKKIQTLGKIVCWLGIITFVLMGLMIAVGGYAVDDYYGTQISGAAAVVVGILVIVIGSVASWVSSFTLIGFGKLVETNEQIAANTARIGFTGNNGTL